LILLIVLTLVSLQAQGGADALNSVVRIDGVVAGAPMHGSGFVVALDRGIATIITASHVIEGASQFQVTFNADSLRSFPISKMVNLEARNPNGLAVFLVQGDLPSGVKPLALADTGGLVAGDNAFLIGYPAMAATPRTLSRSVSRRDGVRYEFDGGVDGGISGGPVVASGRGIGVVVQTEERYSYAMPVTIVREFLLGSGVQLATVSATTSSVASIPGPPATSSGKRPGDVFRDCAECPEMVVIPEGGFTMGSPATEDEREEDEGPQHSVTVRSFALGKYEVTRAQFGSYVKEAGVQLTGGCSTLNGSQLALEAAGSWEAPGFDQTPADPVVCVSWVDANRYITWLSQKVKQSYRLPSEAEWEYAARARTTSRRWWGDSAEQACTNANVADASAKSLNSGWPVHACDDGYVYTAPVGKFRANGFGVFDVLGNAWEWTEDCEHIGYTGAPDTGEAWTTGTCRNRVFRGGSWLDVPRSARSAYHGWMPPTNRYANVGLRVARTLP